MSKKSWINWCQNRKALNCVVTVILYSNVFKILLRFSRKQHPNVFRRWVQVLTEALYPPDSPQTQTPLQRRWTATTGVDGKHEGHEAHPPGWARLTGGQRLHGEPGSGEERHVLQRTSLSTVLQVVLLKLWQRDETLHHPLVLNVNLRERIKKPTSACSNMRTDLFFGLPCSIWGCQAYCWRQSGRLSYQTVCGPHTLP